MTESAWLLVLSSIASAWWLRRRRVMGQQGVGRLIDRAGLPPDEEQAAGAEQRLTRRQAALAIGAWCGSIVGAVPYGLLGATPTALAWWAAFVMVGTGVGACLSHLRTLRSGRVAGPRVASLRQRRLPDFLSPAEIAVLYGLLALPLITAVLGVRALTGNDDQRRGWALVAAATGAGLVFAGTTVMQRWILRANQPAAGEVELRWEEALRAAMLRDVSAVTVGASWALGGLTGFSAVTGWSNEFPEGLAMLALGLYLIGTIALLWFAIAGTPGRRKLSRSQQVTG